MRRAWVWALAMGSIAGAFLTQGAAQPPAPAAPGAGHGFLIDKHIAAGLACTACHADISQPRQPDMAVCTNCHGSYAEIAARTAADQPNPHESHMGQLACASCHHVHEASQTYCARCHNFNMKTP